MTLRDMAQRLQDIIATNDRENRSQYNDLPLYASVQLTPRRKYYFPVGTVWGGCLSIPSYLGPIQPDVRCVEVRLEGQHPTIIKN